VTPKADRDRGAWASRAVQALFLIALISLWTFATTWGHVSPILLPNPPSVLEELIDVLKSGEYIGDLRVTLTELAAAFAISMISGTVVGYLISRSQYSIKVFEPLMAGAYSVPIILFLPLYVLFFGLGPPSKIALGATISFFPIALNTIAGFGYIDKIFTVSARSMGASNYQLFRWVLLPAAFPVILTGLRMGFTVAAGHPGQRDHRVAGGARAPHRASRRIHGYGAHVRLHHVRGRHRGLSQCGGVEPGSQGETLKWRPCPPSRIRPCRARALRRVSCRAARFGAAPRPSCWRGRGSPGWA
jgi:ABC-type nitrate/sulfonate/bicarbonate transport system permease component